VAQLNGNECSDVCVYLVNASIQLLLLSQVSTKYSKLVHQHSTLTYDY